MTNLTANTHYSFTSLPSLDGLLRAVKASNDHPKAVLERKEDSTEKAIRAARKELLRAAA